MNNKKLVFVVFCISVIALLFWTGSRYPQLNEKAIMGGDMPTSGISFDIIKEVDATDTVPVQIFYQTLNWIETNKKGMTFGLLFAAALILLFSLISEKQFNNKWANSFVGLIMGAPLGVCVNCAAPIAKGIADAGGRTETALAMMISSPTMNVIVLSMLFSLFPNYMVLLKLGLTISFILIGIPILTRLFPNRSVQLAALDGHGMPAFPFSPVEVKKFNEQETWFTASKWFGYNYLRSFWFIFKTAVPLMLLAGLLGNVLIVLVPLETLVALLPPTTGFGTLLLMIGIALIGTFLPVPMTFDIIIVAILMAAGLPIKYAMVLLVTLGSYSVYSYFITQKAISFPLAVAMFLTISGLGLIGGIAGHFIEKNVYSKQFHHHAEQLKTVERPPKMYHYDCNSSESSPIMEPTISKPVAYQAEFSSIDNIEISSVAFQEKSNNQHSWFEPIEGPEIGITAPYMYSALHYEPYRWGRIIATGDYDRDGWVDLLLTVAGKIEIYKNINGERFEKQAIPIIENWISGVAFVDLNNDGWLDIFLASFRDGNYISWNKNGAFSRSLEQVPHSKDLTLTMAPAFGDLNTDGQLDMYWGNWSMGGIASKYSVSASESYWLENQLPNWKKHKNTSIAGESLTVLLSDFNMDGHIDLIEGNDFLSPDHFYQGNSKGRFSPIQPKDSLIENTTYYTMSTAAPDLDNDLQPELFQVSIGRTALSKNRRSDICDCIKEETQKANCMKVFSHQQKLWNASIKKQLSACPQEDLLDCTAQILSRMKMGNNVHRFELCDYLPPSWSNEQYFCHFDLGQETKLNPEILSTTIPQVMDDAVLLKKNSKGVFKNVTKEWNVERTGWAWNAKFADLDNDEWVDLFITNGFISRTNMPSKLFYKNKQGQGFENETIESGLENYLPATSYSYVDYDRDGDLDILLGTTIGPMFLYKNHTSKNNSIAFELNDEVGNFYGIGTKVFIYYGEGKHQYRELLLSGGFKSFDEPVAYFGLGKQEEIEKIKIQWSTGEETIVEQRFKTGYRYKIVRKKEPPS